MPGCPADGLYKAPVSPSRLNSYYWFCLEHVRSYNLSWDFYKNMSEAEIESERRADAVWRRPSWRLGGRGANAGFPQDRFKDDYGFFQENTKWRGSARPDNKREKALRTLGLPSDAGMEKIKSRYKALAKKLHPDRNGGDAASEERLKEVNQAYHFLKKSFTS